jgi:hypothetical protein
MAPPPQASGDDATSAIFVYKGIDEIPPTVSKLKVDPTLKVIPPATCLHCDRLMTVELPEGLEIIGRRAFSYCKALKSINIPSTVTEIGKRAFHNCFDLKHITLPDGLLTLEEEAFEGCRSLERIHIPPLIETIEVRSFSGCTNLAEVILPATLHEIKESAFQSCESLLFIDLPSSLKVIGKTAFHRAGLAEIHFPDSVEDCGSFKDSTFANLRLPPLITDFDTEMFELCASNNIVSIELPENVKHIIYPDSVNARLPGMRSIAYPVGCNVHIANDIDDKTKSFLNDLVHQLQHRFDGLPLHKICYYHSYHNTEEVLAEMTQIITPRSTKKNRRSTKSSVVGKRQDLFGMTPLHILACSTKHHLEIYQLLVEKYPENLTVHDMWGEIPLMYAFRCNAPTEIIEFFAESCKRHHPDYVFDWGDMIENLIAHVPLSRLQVLIDTHDQYFPDQEFNMVRLVIRLARGMDNSQYGLDEPFRFLLRSSIVKRLDVLNVKRYRMMFEELIKVITTLPGELEPKVWELYSELDNVERVKETTSVIELALWGTALADQKVRLDNKNHCRVNCGAEIAIRNVMPFLWVPRFPDMFLGKD